MRVDPSFVPLSTERLRLRRSTPEDAEAISAYRSLPEVHEHQGWDRTDPDGIRAEILEMSRRMPGEAGWVQFTVEEARSGHLVGDVGLCPSTDDTGVMLIGYTISPRFQGRGLGTEAVGALAGYAFDVLGAQVLRAYAGASNTPSIRIMEKLGMRLVERFEGVEDDGERWTGVRYEVDRPREA